MPSIDLVQAAAVEYPPAADLPVDRKRALHVIDFALTAYDKGVLPFGDWESGCLNAALKDVEQSYFRSAVANASLSTRPVACRDPHRVARYRGQPTLEETRRAFEALLDQDAGRELANAHHRAIAM
jgi:hypothetical protein